MGGSRPSIRLVLSQGQVSSKDRVGFFGLGEVSTLVSIWGLMLGSGLFFVGVRIEYQVMSLVEARFQIRIGLGSLVRVNSKLWSLFGVFYLGRVMVWDLGLRSRLGQGLVLG
uniref:Uncharacterized protein n=1 Tax=Solanum lycopersicum TaxID=4081 RepID=A0A3Q7FGT8_SOLLC